VEDYAWGWVADSSRRLGGRFALVTQTGGDGESSVLSAWQGYFVVAHQDCELILPPPGTGATSQASARRGVTYRIPPAPPVFGAEDMNSDLTVDETDLQAFMTAWRGRCPGGCGSTTGDFDGSGSIDHVDAARLVELYGLCTTHRQ